VQSLGIGRDPGLDFEANAHLSYFIPAETNVSLESSLKRLGDGNPVRDLIQQRESLFFGELQI
jgi:hypothetical protein